jgi:protein adenylyltransferase
MNVHEPETDLFRFDNSYARLPDRFYAKLPPTPVAAPRLIRLNTPLARELGLDPDELATPAGVDFLVGNRVPEGAEPLAMAYAGHQFGHWVPRLGDGRAVLLGEVVGADGRRKDIQLKGAGPTPFSRMGDGRAALGPVLREFIVSEAMAALGIPTTRALAAVATGEPVFRESVLPGAVLTRIASSHIRVGTFQYFAARDDTEALSHLVDHVIERHYPDLKGRPERARELIVAVAGRQAGLVARWLHVGFIHGVMNTDNMSIAGETIDYGPCAFMDVYHPRKVFSSIDQAGRYAYSNQPSIAYWNLACFAQSLFALLAEDDETAAAVAKDAISVFAERFDAAWLTGMRIKLGLTEPRDDDAELAGAFLDCMARSGTDFTHTFRALCNAARSSEALTEERGSPLSAHEFADWLARWRARLASENASPDVRDRAMRSANPAVIPRNHRVEEAIAAAMDGHFAPFERLLEAVAEPYADRPEFAEYTQAPRPDEVVKQTFCGT